MSAEYVNDLERRLEEVRARRRARATTARTAIPAKPDPPPTKPPPVGEPEQRSSGPTPVPVLLAARVEREELSAAQLEDLARRGDVTARNPDRKFAPSVLHDRVRAVMLALPSVTYRQAYEIAAVAREGESIEDLAQRADLARRGDPVARCPDKKWAESPVHARARKLMIENLSLRYIEALRVARAGDPKS